MATLTIKNIPEELRARLRESASEHRRSMNSEAISCLESVLVGSQVDPHEFLAQVRALRGRMPRLRITDKGLHAARNKGRP